MRRALIAGACIVLVVIYYIMPSPRPCRAPMTYRIERIDERFGLSPRDVSQAVSEAALLWEKAISRELFRESPEGDIAITLAYDYRQEATDRLKALSYHIDTTKGSYDDLKVRLERLRIEYGGQREQLERDGNAYHVRVSAFNGSIEELRGQSGGAAEQGYRRLMREKEELDSLRDNLQTRQEELKRSADTINSLVVVINEIATNLNLEVVNYRTTGATLGDEFFEGSYVHEQGRQTITIYQFGNRERLIRVLAHEFGHALGLKHGNRPEAVMYRLNQLDTLELADEDIALLKARCSGE